MSDFRPLPPPPGEHSSPRGVDTRFGSIAARTMSSAMAASIAAPVAGAAARVRSSREVIAIAPGLRATTARGLRRDRARSTEAKRAVLCLSRPETRASSSGNTRVPSSVSVPSTFGARGPSRARGVVAAPNAAGATPSSETEKDPSGENETDASSPSFPTSTDGGDDGNDSGGNDSGGNGGGGDDENDDADDANDDDDSDASETMRTSAEALAQCERNGVSLPEDVKTIAEAEGLRASVLDRYIALTRGGKIGAGFLTTLFTRFPAIRDRALADPAFLFKLGAEVWGDVGLSVASELKARNTNTSVFSDEAEFFFADVLASAALNAATLTMLSPTVVFGVSPGGGRALRTANRVDGKLNDFLRLVFCRALPPRFPASAFQKGNFTTANRAATVVLQGVRVGGVSVLAGFAGQAAANAACRARRKYFAWGYSDGYADCIHPEAPPLLEPAAEWGAHMAVSGNIRQQLIIGIESAVEASALGAKTPALARAATAALRVGNNAWGGAQFAEKMRVMEAEVYGADEAKNAKKKQEGHKK